MLGEQRLLSGAQQLLLSLHAQALVRLYSGNAWPDLAPQQSSEPAGPDTDSAPCAKRQKVPSRPLPGQHYILKPQCSTAESP